MHYVVYLKDFELFEAVYDASGHNLAQTVESLRKAVDRGDEPFESVRHWLKKHPSSMSKSKAQPQGAQQ